VKFEDMLLLQSRAEPHAVLSAARARLLP